jgi:hypothetical protein
MKTISRDRAIEFLNFLKNRVDSQNHKIADALLADHRVLIKTERAEAQMILDTFLKILDD